MEFEEAGRRKEYLKIMLGFLGEIYSTLSHRGIRAIRFLNGKDDFTAENMSQREEIEQVIDKHKFEGLTCTGTSLMRKILNPFVFLDEKVVKGTPRKIRNMERPLFIIVITDEEVSLLV